MKTNKNPPRLRATATMVLITVAAIGCSDVRKERVEAARIAFDSLPDTEVVSADTKTGLVTIRSRATGQVAVVDVMRAGGARPAWEARPSDANAPPAATASDAGADAVARQVVSAEESAAAAPAEAGTGSAAADQPAPAAATGGRRPLAAVVTRDRAGRIERLEGPGFSVARTGGDARAPVAHSSAAGAAHASGGMSNTARRETTAIVCGPGERRELQNIELDVPGAGIVAQPGCDLRIANARVRAGGWGLVVAAGATVRLDSTVIEGSTGSVDLAPGGTLSAWASTFRGAGGPPTAAAGYVDRGGNAWN